MPDMNIAASRRCIEWSQSVVEWCIFKEVATSPHCLKPKPRQAKISEIGLSKMTKQNHIGSSFDEFLSEENLLEETEAVAIKRVITHQLETIMKQKHLTKTMLAKRMHTSRSSLERLFDPANKSVTLVTLNKAAAAMGKKLEVQLV